MREISKTMKRLRVIHQNRQVIKANYENPSIGSKRHRGTKIDLQEQEFVFLTVSGNTSNHL
jgi:hypothetical protein